jgi:GNAT superfamily N-acetyltransferase
MPSPPSTIPIRPARDEDVPALAALATHLGYPTDEPSMRTRMDRISTLPDHATFVAERAGRVVGFAGVSWGWSYNSDGPYAQLLALVVEPGERGMGTGAALVAAAERWAAEHGAGSITLTTALHREGAHRFYERIGYARTGHRYRKDLR